MINKIKCYISGSIKRRFTFSLTMFLIVPIVLIFLMFNYFARKHYFDQACKVNFEILKQSKPTIASFITDIKLVSELVLSDESTQKYLKLNGGELQTEEAKAKIGLSYNLQSLMLSRDYISSIAVFNDKDILVQFGDYLLKYDTEFMDRVIRLKGKPLWTHAYKFERPAFQESKDKYVVSLIRTINDLYSLKILGYERISINESVLSDLYSAICSSEGEMYIVNNVGQIVSSTDKSLLGQSESKRRYSGNEEGYFTEGDNVVAYYTIKDNDWRVVKIDPKSNFYAAYTELTLALFIFLLLAIIFGFVFKRSQDKSIINPLKRLAEDAARFREGNYSIELRTVENDEIGQLNITLVKMCNYIESLIENEYKSKLYQKEIELKYMQSQINPHFLYNTLDSIRWMAVINGEKEISELIEALSDMFRHTLNYGRSMTTIAEELTNVKNYMKIQHSRFGERIRCNVETDDSLLELPVLHLILLPLVENSLVHGLEFKSGGGTIDIKIYQEGNSLIYCVSDDGVGTDARKITDQLRTKTNVHDIFALNNIDERIKRTFGEAYGLEISSIPGEGTIVIVKMPIIKEIDYERKT